MTLSKAVLTVVNKSSIQMQIADEALNKTSYISAEGLLKLQQAKGKAIQIREHIPTDHEKGWQARAAQIGSYDGKGCLTIAVGQVGKPVTGNADIVSKETYNVDPKLFDAFCKVFEATLADTEAVRAIGRVAKKSAIVEVGFDL